MTHTNEALWILRNNDDVERGHTPPDLHGGGGGAPHQLLRRGGRGGGEGEGDFGGLRGWENGAVRVSLGQIH